MRAIVVAMTLCDEAIALERLLARRRAALSTLLDMDFADRYADPVTRAELAKESEGAREEETAAVAELAALVADLRERAPDVITRWAEAHVTLLEHYLEHVEDPEGTRRFVAGQERDGWREVVAGARAYVDENVYYVHPDRALYRSLFGFDPA